MLLRALSLQIRRHLSHTNTARQNDDTAITSSSGDVTHDFAVDEVLTTAVGGGQCGGTLFEVPGFGVVFRHTTHSESEDAVRVAITRARVLLASAIS